MTESIVRAPRDTNADYDFIAFSFRNKHSVEDFGVYRVSDGNRYNEELSPTMVDKTAEAPGGDGMYYFGTTHKQKVFNIKIAFDNMSDDTLRSMKNWLNGKETGDLWFAETPYKVYTAKVTGTPQLKVLCFDKYNDEGNKIGRIYKGEGTIQFTAYWPYAHTPDYVVPHDWNGIDVSKKHNGKIFDSYSNFGNRNQWNENYTMPTLPNNITTCQGENYGDLPAPFVVTLARGSVDTNIRVGNYSITLKEAASNITWDSKTGMVSGTVSLGQTSKTRALLIEGNSVGAIPVEGFATGITLPDGAILKYHYWYY